MKRSSKNLKSLSQIYSKDPKIRAKLDKIVDVLFRILCRLSRDPKAQTDPETSENANLEDSINLIGNNLYRNLSKLNIKVDRSQLLRNIALILNSLNFHDYNLELLQFDDNLNENVKSQFNFKSSKSSENQLNPLTLTSGHVPLTRNVLKSIFLNVNLKLAPLTNIIY